MENIPIILLPINPTPHDSLEQNLIDDDIRGKKSYKMICVDRRLCPCGLRKAIHVHPTSKKWIIQAMCILYTYTLGAPIGNDHILW